MTELPCSLRIASASRCSSSLQKCLVARGSLAGLQHCCKRTLGVPAAMLKSCPALVQGTCAGQPPFSKVFADAANVPACDWLPGLQCRPSSDVACTQEHLSSFATASVQNVQ